jgi:hypothetical protein
MASHSVLSKGAFRAEIFRYGQFGCRHYWRGSLRRRLVTASNGLPECRPGPRTGPLPSGQRQMTASTRRHRIADRVWRLASVVVEVDLHITKPWEFP